MRHVSLKWVCFLLVALLGLCATAAAAEGRIITTGSVNMRKGPSLDYSAIRTVSEGVTLSYDRTDVDERGVTWYHITYNGKKGWVSSAFAERLSSSGAGDAVTTTGSVYMREGPGLGYDTIRAIDEGMTLTYDKSQKDSRGVTWYRVRYNGDRGWISSKYTRKGSGGSSSADSRVTTTGSLYLRTGPGLDYDDICTIGEGVTLTYDRTERDDRDVTWYHVSYGGRKGWISSKFTRKGSGGSSAAQRLVTTGDVHLRRGPGLDYVDVCVIEEGVTLTWDKREKDERGVTWYHVTYNGIKGWISSRYARLR